MLSEKYKDELQKNQKEIDRRWNLISAVIGVIGTLIGVILGYFLK